MDELLKKADADPEHRRALQIMALRCGATGQLSDDFRDRSKALERAVLPPRDAEEAAQLAELGARIVQQLAFMVDREPLVDVACVRTLRLIGGAEVASVLDGYLDHENEEVLDELAQATNPLRIPSVLAFVTSRDTLERPWNTFKPLRHLREGDLAFFNAPETVQVLNLKGSRLLDAGVLLRFGGLQALGLAETPLTDLAPLQGLTGLQTLNLTARRSATSPRSRASPACRPRPRQHPGQRPRPAQGPHRAAVAQPEQHPGQRPRPAPGPHRPAVAQPEQHPGQRPRPAPGPHRPADPLPDSTQVSDLAPLQGLTGLQTLNLTARRSATSPRSRASPPCSASTSTAPRSATSPRSRASPACRRST